MLTIFRYDLDWGSFGDWTWSASMLDVFLIYFLMDWRSEEEVMLLVAIMIPLLSAQI